MTAPAGARVPADATHDFDALPRPEAVGATDLGASEFSAAIDIFDDDFEPVCNDPELVR